VHELQLRSGRRGTDAGVHHFLLHAVRNVCGIALFDVRHGRMLSLLDLLELFDM
jgi:hypothetical protein